MILLKSIYAFFQNIRLSFFRFPIVVLLSISVFILFVFENHELLRLNNQTKNYLIIRLGLEGLSGIALFLSFDLFALNHKVPLSKKIGLYLLGFCILGLHFYSITPGMFDYESIFVSRYLIFSLIYHLMVSFSVFHNRASIDAFWNYNYYLFIHALRTIAFSVSLFLGFVSLLWAIDNLFGLSIHENVYIDFALIIFIVFATIFFLNGIPKDFTIFNQKVEYKKSIKSFTQYVLMPITLLYMAILYLYALKVLMEARFPNGWICIPILIFSAIGVFTYLQVYPVRQDKSNKLFFNFNKYFFYTLLPLLALYFISILQRIKAYGLTEDRYLVFVLGIWLLVVSIYCIVSEIDNIIVIPISLCLLLSISAIGPWGMFQLSGRNQLYRLEKILTRNKILVDNKLTKNTSNSISKQDSKSIQSILYYLQKRGELNRLHPWLVGEDKLILEEAITNDEIYNLGILFNPKLEHFDSENQRSYIVSATPLFFEENFTKVGFANSLLRFTVFYEQELKDSINSFTIIENSNLKFGTLRDTIFSINLNVFIVQRLHQQRTKDSIILAQDNSTNSLKITRHERELNFEPDSMVCPINDTFDLLLNKIYFHQSGTIIKVNEIHGYLRIRDTLQVH